MSKLRRLSIIWRSQTRNTLTLALTLTLTLKHHSAIVH